MDKLLDSFGLNGTYEASARVFLYRWGLEVDGDMVVGKYRGGRLMWVGKIFCPASEEASPRAQTLEQTVALHNFAAQLQGSVKEADTAYGASN